MIRPTVPGLPHGSRLMAVSRTVTTGVVFACVLCLYWAEPFWPVVLRYSPCSAGPISQLRLLLLGAPLTKVLLLQYGTANSSRLIGPAEQGDNRRASELLRV